MMARPMWVSLTAALAKTEACVQSFLRSSLDIYEFVLALPLALFQIKGLKVKRLGWRVL